MTCPATLPRLRFLPMQSPSLFFFFNDTATTEIYTLSLPDALPIFDPFGYAAFTGAFAAGVSRERVAEAIVTSPEAHARWVAGLYPTFLYRGPDEPGLRSWLRSEEHTSELQSQSNLVCRLLLEKKNT